MDDVWKVVGVGDNVTVFNWQRHAMASYCCRLCKAPVPTKHTVAIFSPTTTKQ